MSPERIDRREFLDTTTRAGIAVCGACFCASLPALAAEEDAVEIIDPAKLNRCGYTCPEDCKFKRGTLENDIELKKEAFALWKIEERYGVEFDPETAICHGCKADGKPEGVAVKYCTVRSCAQEKKLECCIECDELVDCEKDLWKRFPDFKKAVIALQVQYRQQQAQE